MLLIPSIDVEAGRSRIVFWPGASTGAGTPTDRPERIARHFVERGATLVHVVDLDGARAGAPANLEVIGRIASTVATPLQLAGGVDGPAQIELAFAAGATRVVLPLFAVVESPDVLRRSLEIAGSWLAIGMDPRADRWRAYPWRTRPHPTIPAVVERLAGAGVVRIVLSHAGPEAVHEVLQTTAGRGDLEVLVAGGVASVAELLSLRDAGVAGAIVGQPLLSGQLDYGAAVAALATPA